jgi:hypothetical protein
MELIPPTQQTRYRQESITILAHAQLLALLERQLGGL